MNQPPFSSRGVDLRSFRWPLQALERKVDGALETARLALTLARGRERALQQQVQRQQGQQVLQQRLGCECVQRDPRLASPVAAYLAALAHDLRDAQARAAQAHLELEQARAECLAGQRQLACLQALRREAQRAHAQAQLRRDAKEADAAWLARSGQQLARAGRRADE